MGDLILLIGFLAMVAFGYYVMASVDRFLAGLRGDRRPFGTWHFRRHKSFFDGWLS